jgi:hypothetical protein
MFFFIYNFQNNSSYLRSFHLLFFIGFTLANFLSWYFFFNFIFQYYIYRLGINFLFWFHLSRLRYFDTGLRDFLWFSFYSFISIPSFRPRVWWVGSNFFLRVSLFKFNILSLNIILFWNWVACCFTICLLFDYFIHMIKIIEFGLLGVFWFFFKIVPLLILSFDAGFVWYSTLDFLICFLFSYFNLTTSLAYFSCSVKLVQVIFFLFTFFLPCLIG